MDAEARYKYLQKHKDNPKSITMNQQILGQLLEMKQYSEDKMKEFAKIENE